MLVSWGRIFIRGVALKPFLQCKPVTVSGGQLLPARALATIAKKKVASKTAATKPKASTKKPSTTRTKQGATRKVAAKSATTRAGAKKTGTKKVVAKKGVAKKAAKKGVAKKGVAKKGAASSVKTRTRVPKKMSEEEKKKVKLRARVKELLGLALKPPPIHMNSSPWVLFLTEKLKGHLSQSKPLGENIGKLKEEYSKLTPAQLESLRVRGKTSQVDKQKALSEWVKAHRPSTIHDANVARAAIRRLKKLDITPIGLRGSFPSIPDDRYPVRPRSAHVFYLMEKMKALPQEQKKGALGSLVKEYSALGQVDKKKYIDQAAEDTNRFRQQLKDVGIEPPPTSSA